jgi:hypothetical protein
MVKPEAINLLILDVRDNALVVQAHRGMPHVL